MKMVKSLILGTAVAFAASAGAQAADLPVKAKPVSYVKICPQYGPGFYYIPGTDICLKLGGVVFAEAGYNARSAVPFLGYGAGGFGPTTNYTNWRTFGLLAVDARQQTSYGTLRSYIYGGFSATTGQNGLNGTAVNATAAGALGGGNAGAFLYFAFIQFAGFTAGQAVSFFDFAPNYMTLANASTPWNWNNLFAYTANLGNGLSATISIEDSTNTNVTRTVAGAPVAFGYEAPDIVANLRLSQAWGSAQISAAAKQLRFNGQANDEWGFAVSGGLEIKTPFTGAPGNTIKFQAVMADGAVEYTGLGQHPFLVAGVVGVTGGAPGTLGVVLVSDANVTTGVVTKTEASSVSVQYRHFWTPTVRSSFHAGHTEAYNFATFGSVQVAQYGHSLAWSPVKDLTLALDVLYTEVDANNVDSDIIATWFRVTRTF